VTATVPEGVGLSELRAAAKGCQGCELWEPATQTVFGAGPETARIVFVGEQPGDQEDQRGEPFVGPAGRLLDRALGDARIDREDAYVTNAVKHFRFRSAGRRRIHQSPDAVHIRACHPWLDAELALLTPEVVVCLGAVAAKALIAPSFRITKDRGRLMPRPVTLDEDAAVAQSWLLATIHPSAILRTPDEERDEAYEALVADLKVAASVLA